MQKTMTVLCVLTLLAWAGQAWGIDHVWDNATTDGYWNTAGNWGPDHDEVPSWGDTATVGDNLTAYVDGNFSSLSGPVYVGNAGGTGTIEVIVNRGLYAPLRIGSGGSDGTVTVKGSLTSGDCHIGGTGDGTENGILTLDASGFGSVTYNAVIMDLGDNAGNKATWDIQSLPTGNGIALSGVSGQSSVPFAQIGLQFGGSATAANNNVLYKAVADTVINFTGCSHAWADYYADPDSGTIWHRRNPSFVNQCTDDTATGLGDLNNTTFVYEGFEDSTAHYKRRTKNGCGEFEAGGEDLGKVMDGLSENFALAGLTLKTSKDASEDQGAEIKLVDNFDNGNRSSTEAVYVENLVLEAYSILHTNGINLYYLNGTIDADATVDTIGGGDIYQIPEPATLALLGLGGIGVLLRRKRR